MTLSLLQRFKYSPFFTQMVVVRKCNLSCGYCNEFDKTSEPVPLQTLKDRLDKLRELGAFSVCFTGGEPTLHPDLAELIRYSRQHGQFVRTSMITNGFLLTRELIESLNEAGLQDMQISIDGVKPNDVTVKVLDSLRKRLALLKEHAKFNVVVSGVVGSCPPAESYEVIEYAKNMGFRPRVLLIHGPDGQIKLSPEELAVYRRIKQVIPGHIFDSSRYKDKIIEKGSHPFKCRAGSRYLYVDEHGTVNWCSQTRAYFGKPLVDYTADDLKEQFYTHKSCQDGCTLGCVRTASNFDNWRRQDTPGTLAQPQFTV